MYLEVGIPVPALPGVITRQRIQGTVYVNYEYARIYDRERRFNVPKRATIGKLAKDGLMIPNENYRKYFPAEDLPGTRASTVRCSCLRIGSSLFFLCCIG